MKKILSILALALFFSATSQARFFLGGTAGIAYSKYFTFALVPQVGYEINDKWAIGTGLGVELVSNDRNTEVYGDIMPFGRYNIWNNSHVFIDLKAKADMAIGEYFIANIGFAPSIRFKFHSHWDASADLGLFGANYDGYQWNPAFGIATNVNLNVTYTF